MTDALISGTVFGLGLWLLWFATFGSKQPLSASMRSVQRAQPAMWGSAVKPDWKQQVQNDLTSFFGSNPWTARLLGADVGADLRITGDTVTAHLVRKTIALGLVLILAPVILTFLSGLLGVSWLMASWLVLAMALFAFTLPDRRVREEAKMRRRDFAAALSSYFDLVALRAASGSGLSESLRDAAEIGDGQGWRQIRSALQSARLAGHSPARAMETLGKSMDLPDLVELAAQLALVDESGAQMASTLRAKADALRSRERTQIAGDANARTTAQQLSLILIAVGYVIMLGFPPFMRVMGL